MKPTTPSVTRKIDLIGLGTVIALNIAVYLVGVEPIVARESEIRASRMELEAAQEAMKQAERSLADVRRQVTVAEQALEDNPMRLQPIGGLNARLAEITATASRHGLQIDQLEPGRPTTTTHYLTLPIRMTGRSAYGGAARFLHELRESMPDLAVETLALTGEPRNRSAIAKFELALLWHASPNPVP